MLKILKKYSKIFTGFLILKSLFDIDPGYQELPGAKCDARKKHRMPYQMKIELLKKTTVFLSFKVEFYLLVNIRMLPGLEQCRFKGRASRSYMSFYSHR
jgi:hypothetical protein